MSSLRVISGKYRGKIIPFNPVRFNADITPQKVKGALFSILGEDLTGKSFLDLYAGSGQIGIEAISRGASPVAFIEKDPRRNSFIKKYINNLDEKDNICIYKTTAINALDIISDKNMFFDFIFIDPPYNKTRGSADQYTDILNAVLNAGILINGSVCVAQHFSKNIIGEKITGLAMRDTKVYGNTSLSIFDFQIV